MTTGNTARRGMDPVRVLSLTWAWGGVDFRQIRRWRSAAAFLVLCASLAAPLLGAGGSAQAEELVSNLGESATSTSATFGVIADKDLAQVFKTGTNAAGYTLTSVEMAVRSAISAADIGDLSVEVWSVDGAGNPQTKQFDLTNPASIDGATISGTFSSVTITGNYAVFTAPSNKTLTTMTAYAIVLTYDQQRGFWTTESGTETSAASGWSIADGGRKKSSGGSSWSEIKTILIRVNGEAKTVPTSADKTVVTPEDTDHTFLTADFAFTDTDMGDTLSSVKIVSLPGLGTLTLSGTAIPSEDLPKTVLYTDLAIGNLKYVPPANDNGAALASFTFRVNDGTADSVATNTMTVNVTAVSDTPTSADKTVGTPEDTEYTFSSADFAFTDTDMGDTLSSVKIVSLPVLGTLTLSDTAISPQTVAVAQIGNLKYVPPANDNGAALASFTFRVNDGTADSVATNTMTVNVTAVNDAPTSADKTVGTPEDTEYTFSSADFAFTDTDMGDTLSSVKIVTLPVLGTLTLSDTAISPQTVAVAQIGNLSYVPPANDNGAALASFTFRVNDGTADSVATNTMTVNVTAVNDAPTSADKTVVTPEDTEYIFSSADFAFTDTEGGSLSSVKIVTLPVLGTLMLSDTAISPQTVVAVAQIGNLSYVPPANDNGAALASFTFRVNDGTADSVATNTMTVNVTAVSDAPTSADKTVVMPEDTEYTFSSADFAFTDTDMGDTLSSVKIVTLPVLGTLTLSDTAISPQTVSAADLTGGLLKYVPPANESGAALASFTFRVNDGTADSVATNTMTVNVTAVNDAPTSADKTVGTPEDTEYTFSSADFTFTDTDMGDTLSSVKIVSLPATGKGTLRLSGAALGSGSLPQTVSAADLTGGLLKYRPPANESGAALASFTFGVNDGTADSVATNTMTVNVTAVNDAPTSADKTVGTPEDTDYTFLASDFAFMDTDMGVTLSNMKIVSLPATGKGTLTLSGTALTSGDLPQTVLYTDLAVGTLKYVPPANDNGAALASFTFRVNDGTADSVATNTMTVNVTAVNDAPTSADKTVGTPEDTDYTFSSSDFAFTDTDMGDTLSSVKIVSLPAPGKGTLRLSGAALGSGSLPQTVSAADLTGGLLKYRPPANESGAALASFTFRVNDGTADSVATKTMTVNVTAVNDATTGKPGIAGTARVGLALMATAGTIADPDGLPDPFLTDTNTSFQWVRVTSGTDADISGAMASTYTLVDADNGKTIRVKVSFQDKGGSSVGPLTSDAYPSGAMVLPALSTNTAPTSADKTVVTPEDTAYTFSSADFAFTDTDMGDSLSSVKIVTLPAMGKGTLRLSGTAISPQTVAVAQIGNLSYVPPANDSGTALASFTFKVNDGTDDSAATNTMTVNVMAVNDAPTSANKEVVTPEDTEYTFSSADFSFTDTDMGDTLSSVKIVTLPATGKGTLTLSGTAITSALPQTVTAADLAASTLKYVPPANESGTALASFTFRVNDGTADSLATKTMTVNVMAVNDAAMGKPGIAGTARVGQELMATVGTIADPDGLPDPFLTDPSTSFQWVRVTSGTDADISGATASTYTLVDADNGKTIRVKVSFQDKGGSSVGPLTSDAYPSGGTVLPAANNPPTSADKTVVTPEDTEYTFSSVDFAFTDTDMGDTLSSVKIVLLPATGKGTLTLSGTAIPSGELPKTVGAAQIGTLKYVPPANESGTALASFTFRVNDGTDDSVATYTMTVNVTAVNDAATGQPGIAGTARVGQALMATAGTIADPDGLPDPFLMDPSTSFQWVRVTSGTDADISGATASTYTLVDADNGKTIRVKVSFTDLDTNDEGPLTSDAYPSGATVLPALSTNTAPTSADKTMVTPEDTEYTFSSADFAFTDTDMGDTLSSVKIVLLPATGKGTLTLSGTAIPSGPLPKAVGAAQIGTLKYVPPANESGTALASFTFRVNDGTDDSVATNTMTVNVMAVNDAATGKPGIAGTARVGQALMATAGTIADPDGLPDPFLMDTSTSFQWVRVTSGTDADISGATASTYTLVDADNGKTIRVKVSFTDLDTNDEGPLTSDAYPSGATVLPALSTNTAPTSADKTMVTPEDTEYTFSSADFPFTDTDMGDTLSSVKIVLLPATGKGTLMLSGTAIPSGPLPKTVGAAQIGTLKYVPPANESGAALASFTFRVNDGTDDSVATNTMIINVTAVNDAAGKPGIARVSRALMARFGRTVADQVLSSVEDRMTAPRTSGTEVRLAGHRLGAVDRDTGDHASGENTARAGTVGRTVAGREEEAKAAGKVAREAERKVAVGLRALANQLGGDGNNGNYGKRGHNGLFGGFEARAAAKKSRGITGREMLTGSAFTLTEDTAGGNHGALWGRGAVSSFDGRTGGFGLDGEVVSAILGMDGTEGPALMGVALGHSRGEGAYRSEDGEPANGEIVTTLTGLYPYARYEVNERLSVWGVVGHGLGRMTLTPEGLAPMETNAHLVMAALGGRGVLRQPLDGIGLELAVRSDALAVRGSGTNLASTAAEVTRLRLGIEGAWHDSLPVPTFEIGVRYDGGDAETGFGADLGAGLTWADPVRGIRAEFHARGLVGHEDDGFREFGLSGLLFWDFIPDSDLGWSLGITQAMGARATGGMDALLNPDTTRVFGFDDSVDSSDALHDDDLDRRLAADLGYGFAMFGGRYTGTPAVGLRRSEAGRETVLGWSLAESQKSGLVFGLDVVGRRHESVGGEPGHSFGGGFGWQRAGERSGEPGFGVRFEGERLAADRDGEPEHRFGGRMTARW